MKKVTLLLDDGTSFHGSSFGAEHPIAGEVVFNTAMTGYSECLTDPTNAGQLIVFTYPLIGNYGVPPFTFEANGLAENMESDKIQASGIIVTDYSEGYSHWSAIESLSDWLKRENIPAITGIDTRELTKVLRDKGVMMGKIIFDDDAQGCPSATYEDVNFVKDVSCKEVIRYNEGKDKKKVVLVDCGVKNSAIRRLIENDLEVIRVPWNYDFNQLDFDGLFLSNGPGNPCTCDETIKNIQKFLESPVVRPCIGYGMGNLLLAKAAGASTYKLKYGHRGHNQPIRKPGTEKCFITSQNHGYAVDCKTLTNEWEELFVNMNDGSNAGIRHKKNPWFGAQFHLEANNGPVDTDFLLNDYLNSFKN